jgi:hypothetical protein
VQTHPSEDLGHGSSNMANPDILSLTVGSHAWQALFVRDKKAVKSTSGDLLPKI